MNNIKNIVSVIIVCFILILIINLIQYLICNKAKEEFNQPLSLINSEKIIKNINITKIKDIDLNFNKDQPNLPIIKKINEKEIETNKKQIIPINIFRRELNNNKIEQNEINKLNNNNIENIEIEKKKLINNLTILENDNNLNNLKQNIVLLYTNLKSNYNDEYSDSLKFANNKENNSLEFYNKFIKSKINIKNDIEKTIKYLKNMLEKNLKNSKIEILINDYNKLLILLNKQIYVYNNIYKQLVNTELAKLINSKEKDSMIKNKLNKKINNIKKNRKKITNNIDNSPNY